LDAELTRIVRAVNEAGAKPGTSLAVPMTLVTGGTLISGFLVSGREWWDEVHGELEQAPFRPPVGRPAANPEALRDQLAHTFAEVRDVYARHPGADEHACFLHLRSARAFEAGGVVPTEEGALMLRVRLEEVQAWSFGSLERTGPPSEIVTELDA
jgi:hypothetical protein